MFMINMEAFKLPKILIDLQIPLLYLTNILALAIGPRNQVLRYGITVPLFALLVGQSWFREWSGAWGMHYALECMVVSVVWIYFDWNVLGRPDREGWRKTQYGGEGKKVGEKENGHVNGNGGANGHANGQTEKEKHSVPQDFLKRAWWGTRLATGNRYVGWSQEVKNVPKEVAADYPRV
jgi:hypothetical protein